MSRHWEPSTERGPSGLQVPRLRPYTGACIPLRDEDLVFFYDRYELRAFAISGHIYRTDDGRYLLPVYDPRGTKRGWVARVPWNGAPIQPTGVFPKADTFRSVQGPVQSHYRDRASDGQCKKRLVLVEDQLSAIKLAAYGFDSVALLGTPTDLVGTYGGQDRVAEIAKRARTAEEVIVALDADATDAAFMFARKWGSAFHRLRVAILERDIKDTKAADLREVLGV